MFKDLKQILRKEQCDASILLTANVPAAKKIIVHGPGNVLNNCISNWKNMHFIYMVDYVCLLYVFSWQRRYNSVPVPGSGRYTVLPDTARIAGLLWHTGETTRRIFPCRF